LLGGQGAWRRRLLPPWLSGALRWGAAQLERAAGSCWARGGLTHLLHSALPLQVGLVQARTHAGCAAQSCGRGQGQGSCSRCAPPPSFKTHRHARALTALQALVMTHTVAVAHHDPDGSTSSRPLGRQMFLSQLSAATRQVGPAARPRSWLALPYAWRRRCR
jgi:hypothetical protein